MDRETLQDIAIKVLIENRNASMQDIAAAAGIGRTTLHRYFASRKELLRSLTMAALTDVDKVSRLEEGSALEALERAVQGLIPIGHRFHFLLSDWVIEDEEQDEELDAIDRHRLARYEALMQRGQREGILRNDLPARWMVEVVTALLFTAWKNIRDGYLAPRDAPQLVMTTLIAGIGTNKEGKYEHTNKR